MIHLTDNWGIVEPLQRRNPDLRRKRRSQTLCGRETIKAKVDLSKVEVDLATGSRVTRLRHGRFTVLLHGNPLRATCYACLEIFNKHFFDACIGRLEKLKAKAEVERKKSTKPSTFATVNVFVSFAPFEHYAMARDRDLVVRVSNRAVTRLASNHTEFARRISVRPAGPDVAILMVNAPPGWQAATKPKISDVRGGMLLMPMLTSEDILIPPRRTLWATLVRKTG
jgi:hypothetical protein